MTGKAAEWGQGFGRGQGFGLGSRVWSGVRGLVQGQGFSPGSGVWLGSGVWSRVRGLVQGQGFGPGSGRRRPRVHDFSGRPAFRPARPKNLQEHRPHETQTTVIFQTHGNSSPDAHLVCHKNTICLKKDLSVKGAVYETEDTHTQSCFKFAQP